MLAGTLVTVLVALMLAACASMQAEPEPNLYKRLGGREGIALVVDDFVNNMAADPRVNARFKAMPVPAVLKLKTNIADLPRGGMLVVNLDELEALEAAPRLPIHSRISSSPPDEGRGHQT
jgi:hypothetical protein